jgi:hypothetical protein
MEIKARAEDARGEAMYVLEGQIRFHVGHDETSSRFKGATLGAEHADSCPLASSGHPLHVGALR